MTKLLAQDEFAQFASQMARHPRSLDQLRELMKDADRKRAIGERIAALRERRGLTQPQLMEKAGLGAGRFRNLQNWEAGKGTSHDNYEALAEALGCSYDYLISGAEVAPPTEDILARLSQIEAKLELLLDALGPDAAVQVASDAAQPRPESGRQSVPEPASNAKTSASRRHRAAQR